MVACVVVMGGDWGRGRGENERAGGREGTEKGRKMCVPACLPASRPAGRLLLRGDRGSGIGGKERGYGFGFGGGGSWKDQLACCCQPLKGFPARMFHFYASMAVPHSIWETWSNEKRGYSAISPSQFLKAPARPFLCASYNCTTRRRSRIRTF